MCIARLLFMQRLWSLNMLSYCIVWSSPVSYSFLLLIITRIGFTWSLASAAGHIVTSWASYQQGRLCKSEHLSNSRQILRGVLAKGKAGRLPWGQEGLGARRRKRLTLESSSILCIRDSVISCFNFMSSQLSFTCQVKTAHFCILYVISQ